MGSQINKFKAFIISFVLVILTATIGNIFTSRNVDTWYLTINRPSFLPPNFIFPIAWTILFILMIISFYLVLTSKTNHLKSTNLVNTAIVLFVIQLIFNALWCYLFFQTHFLLLSVIEILILELLIILNIIVFYKINKTSAYLLIPYALWVLFATALTIGVYVLN